MSNCKLSNNVDCLKLEIFFLSTISIYLPPETTFLSIYYRPSAFPDPENFPQTEPVSSKVAILPLLG